MIKSITITNHRDEALHLILTQPEKSGIIVASVEGLNPPKANINTVEMANMDGSIYTSSKAEPRNIVFQLVLMDCLPEVGAETIEDARHKLYRYFPLKHEIRIDVETDTKISTAWGYVESNETYIFSKQEYAQISVVCPDPWFYDMDVGRTVFTGVESQFEFPFSNESLTDNLIEFGAIHIDTHATLFYSGDVDTGMTITIHFTGDVKNINLYDISTQETMKIDTDKIEQVTGFKVSSGDTIYISTIKGSKYIRYLHAGQTYNIISAMAKDSDWFQLLIGENTFAFSADEGQENMTVTFAYRSAYGGI